MITARQTRLLRVNGLAGLQRALIDLAGLTPSARAGDTFVLVPTRAAGRQLRRTLDRAGRGVALVIGTRADLYGSLASRLPDPPPQVGPVEREVIVGALARLLESEGIRPPFDVRPGLMVEVIGLYDHVRRLGRTLDDFERNIGDELSLSAESDRGAAQLLVQTQFLAALFRRYETRLVELGLIDEHGLRDHLIHVAARAPLQHVIVTVADRTADPDGLWPEDFALLTRLTGLQTLDVVATENLLSAGWLERVHALLPGLAEVRGAGCGVRGAGDEVRGAEDEERRAPVLIVPRDEHVGPAGPLVHFSRDREEELAQVARRVKAERRAGRAVDLGRIALVVRRPLPYLYLATEVLGSAGIPFDAEDALPLAAEPFAAAVDLVLDVVVSGCSRVALVALLRSPHFDFHVDAAAVSALDRALADSRYLGDPDRLQALASAWSAIAAPASRDERRQAAAAPAARRAVEVVRALAPLGGARPLAEQVGVVLAFVDRCARPDQPGGTDDADRGSRARAGVLQALMAMAAAHRARDEDVRVGAEELSATIRRWLSVETMSTALGRSGLQILDFQAARFGAFDDVQVVGLIEGEWPERPRRSVFYPASLLALLEPGPATSIDAARRERDQLRAARASFRDLIGLARRRVRASTFALENEAVVEASTLVDELAAMGLSTEIETDTARARVFLHEAVAQTPPALAALAPLAAEWARVRAEGDRGPDPRFHGETGPWVLPRISVSRIDRYLDCPFRFFASEVLRIEEEPEDEDQRTPLERGRFLHEIFETFFREWQASGQGRITPATVPVARARLTAVCERALAALSPSEAALERARLLGSAAGAGIVERVLTLEAERDDEVRERLIEFPIEGALRFRTAEGDERVVSFNAKVDRVDVLASGGVRLIDYKSKVVPGPQKIQLPIYASAVRQRLAASGMRDATIREALYLSFEGDRPAVPLKVRRGGTLAEAIADGEDRFLGALDAVAQGRFPPRPNPRSLCNTCPFGAVCRGPLTDAPEEADEQPAPNADE